MRDTSGLENPAVEALMGQVVDDFLERLRRGERPEIEDYVRRHPPLATVLRQMLPALELVQQAPGEDAVAEASPAEIRPEGPLGDYRILREIGRGGMGVVYEAVQISLGRRVALKVLPFAAALDGKQLQRFKNEAQAAAQLHHTNIVPVHGVGCERGVHFYAMQFIEGQSLAEVIRELRLLAGLEVPNGPDPPGAASAWASDLTSGKGLFPKGGSTDPQATGPSSPPPAATEGPAAETARQPVTLSTEGSTRSPAFFRAAANLGIQAAEALEHAHKTGVVHRDIKPANLLVDARGHLWVTDFGLAHVQGDGKLTLTGDLVGTLRYLSPEQALAQRVVVDHRTDIYSLGVTLYELLALEPAFPGRDRAELLAQIAFEEPRPPRKLNPAVPTELETIALKAMAKNPEERYATAQELADDLRRFLEDRPVLARRPSLWQRLRKWLRRHRSVVTAAGVSAVAGLLITVAVLVASYWQIRGEQKQTRDEQRKTQAALDRERQTLYFHRIALANSYWWASHVARSEQLLEECPPGFRRWEWHYLKRLCHASRLNLPADRVCGLAYSPDGRRLAAAGCDGTVKVWDAQTGQEVLTLSGHADQVDSVAFSPRGQRLATGGKDRTVRLWDAANGRQLSTLEGHTGGVCGVAFSHDGRLLASGGEDKSVRVWDVMTGQELLHLCGHADRVCGVAFNPDGQWLASASWDMTVKLWDPMTGREVRTLRRHASRVLAVAFSPDGKRLASGGWDRTLWVWDTEAGQELYPLLGHTAQVSAVAFSPDGNLLASASVDKTVKVWETVTGQELFTLRGHSGGVAGVAFCPHGKRLASGGVDRSVRIWNVTGQEARTLWGHTAELTETEKRFLGTVFQVTFHPHSKRLASAGSDQTVRVWDPANGREILTLRGHTGGEVLGVAYSPDGRWIASAGGDQTVRLWDAATGRVLRTFAGHQDVVRKVAFSPDGQWLASASHDGTLKLWEVARDREPRTLTGHQHEVYGLAVSHDGKRLASASLDRTVKLWDAATGAKLLTLKNGNAMAFCVAFSPDGTRVAAGGGHSGLGTAKVWDASTGDEVYSLKGHTSAVWGVAFSPGGGRIATVSADNTVMLWDTATGQEVLTLRGHTNAVHGVAFSPDGRYLATSDQDGTIKLWDGTPWEARPGGKGPFPEATDPGEEAPEN
jgi:eukaryotic-like serine/threonine-protein kinase